MGSSVPVGRRVRVQVPATSANLGPAFDAAGLALELYDEVEVEATGPRTDGAAGLQFVVRGEGARDVARDHTHLVARTVHETLRRLDADIPALAFHCINRIPHARGLGSSAAAIVAGILAARELVPGGGAAMPLSRVLALATELEGHPDNVAAALLGGLTLAWTGPATVLSGTETGAAGTAFVVATEGVGVVRVQPSADVEPVLLVPPLTASTRAARGVLPASVTHVDAAVAAGRSALLIAALLVAPAVLLPATHDVLHQPYRTPLMPETAALVATLRAAGLAAVVSGAGPSVLVLAAGPAQAAAAGRRCPTGWQTLRLAVGAGATVGLVADSG